jgi:hypothetical protein
MEVTNMAGIKGKSGGKRPGAGSGGARPGAGRKLDDKGLLFRPRYKDERGNFIVFPVDDVFIGDTSKVNLQAALGRVNARTYNEALTLARKKYNREDLVVFEDLSPARIVNPGDPLEGNEIKYISLAEAERRRKEARGK